MTKELAALASSNMKIEVVAPPGRKYSMQSGGFIQLSLTTLLQRSMREYGEPGLTVEVLGGEPSVLGRTTLRSTVKGGLGIRKGLRESVVQSY